MSRKPFQHRLCGLLAFVRCTLSYVLICAMMVCAALPAQAATTLLVNTESFEEIDSGDATSNVELRFGLTAETLTWNIVKSRFEVTDDMHVEDNLTASGGLAVELNVRAKGNVTLNSDGDAADATLTFGSAVLPQTLKLADATQKFTFSQSVDVLGTMSGEALRVSGSAAIHGALALSGALRVESGTQVVGTLSGSRLRLDNLTHSGGVLYGGSGGSVLETAKGLSGQLLVSRGTDAPQWKSATTSMVWYIDGDLSTGPGQGAKVYMPFALNLTDVKMLMNGAPTGTGVLIDVKKDGASIFSTLPRVSNGSVLGGTGAVLSTTLLPQASIITLDINTVGSTFSGSGLTVLLNGTKKY